MNTFLDSFDRRFLFIHERSLSLIKMTPDAVLFEKPRELPRTFTMFSVGEYILRSAAAVEQTFGGITTKLWDDPFEWTLPEKLNTQELILEYLGEVETTRINGFNFFTSDEDLKKQIPAPERLTAIFDLILDTVSRAEHYQGRAFSVFQMFSDEKLPG